MPDAFDTYLTRYDRACVKAAQHIILTYSTSFSLATRALAKPVRTDIRNLYAMARIADEIVDGTAGAAGLDQDAVRAELDAYEQAVLAAPDKRFHADPVLHAYALTARRCGFDPEHISAFFSSMRCDLEQASYGQEELEEYVYGSAEVIGLLCLSVFLVDHPVTDAERARMATGARALGAAFQKINFLRDLAEDTEILGRAYLPGLAGQDLTGPRKAALVAEIRSDLDHACAVIPLLPMSARVGVLTAAELFRELTDRIDALPAADLKTRRVSVPGPTKAALLARAAVTAPRLNRPEGR